MGSKYLWEAKGGDRRFKPLWCRDAPQFNLNQFTIKRGLQLDAKLIANRDDSKFMRAVNPPIER
jgi:hypothetical protein